MRKLIIGSGFVGSDLAKRIVSAGSEAVLASRRPPTSNDTVAWVPLDVTIRNDCARVIDQADCDAIVLVHGPSDVTWCQKYPEETLASHKAAAENIAHVADGRRVVMVSTDNVFDGSLLSPDESSIPCPGNAYGKAKLAAEQAIRLLPNSVVLRVSLIYGWEPVTDAKWLNFFVSCAHRLLSGQQVVVPFDQWTTPVLLEDVTTVISALLTTASAPSLLHLGGPERISRAAWASLIADQLDVAPDLVVAEPKANGRYAHRPVNSCLSSHVLSTHASTSAIRIRGPKEGAHLLIHQDISCPALSR